MIFASVVVDRLHHDLVLDELDQQVLHNRKSPHRFHCFSERKNYKTKLFAQVFFLPKSMFVTNFATFCDPCADVRVFFFSDTAEVI